MTDRDRSRSRSPDRNGGDHRGDSGHSNGAGEEVKLYIGNLDYGA
jgi:hypothetical protein